MIPVWMKGNFVTLKPDSPFAGIFENNNVPVKNWIFPSKAQLIGSDETEVYMLDASLHQTRGAPVKEVLDQIKTTGLPIRASQIQTAWSTIPGFL